MPAAPKQTERKAEGTLDVDMMCMI